jgi:surfeit locus 1 family protein
MPNRRLYIFLAASLLGIAVLLGLGLWQLERLQWKKALLADLERAVVDAASVSLAEAEDIMARDTSKDYLRVELKGRFDHSSERYLFSLRDREAGWQVVTPFITRDRRIVLVDRGFVPERLKQPETRLGSQIDGETRTEGFLRKHRGRGLFTPANRPDENVWYWPDVAAMLASLDARPGLTSSNFLVQELPSHGVAAWPRAQRPNPAAIPNNHLQYALTWFALALILAIMTFMVIRKAAKEQGRGT